MTDLNEEKLMAMLEAMGFRFDDPVDGSTDPMFDVEQIGIWSKHHEVCAFCEFTHRGPDAVMLKFHGRRSDSQKMGNVYVCVDLEQCVTRKLDADELKRKEQADRKKNALSRVKRMTPEQYQRLVKESHDG